MRNITKNNKPVPTANHQTTVSHPVYRTSRNHLKTLALCGAIGAASLLGPLASAQAQTYYGGSNSNWNRNNRNVTVYGTVTRDLQGRDRFAVRLDNGRTTEVISRRNEPPRLSRGDRVMLRGDFERGLFIADDVRVIRNEGPGRPGRPGNDFNVVQRGVVTRDLRGREFEIRLDNGRNVTVRDSDREPLRLTRGDYVEVRGYYSGNVLVARDVRILRNDDRNRVNISAVVVRRDSYNRLTVRGENGRTYTVTSSFSLARFNRNDRIRIVGIVNGSTITASSVDLLRR